MRITVNGAAHETAASTVEELVKELGHGEAKVATALNEAFVPVAARAGQPLSPGDRVEILAPRQGG